MNESTLEILVTLKLGKQKTSFEENSTYSPIYALCRTASVFLLRFFFSPFLYFLLSSAFTLQFQNVRTEKEELETQLLRRAGTK